MADPKYENLPGIAYDQPDVYETGDLPESDQHDGDEENDNENECIENTHIAVGDSFRRFRGKQVHGAPNVDFSDRITAHVRTGYKCGEWALAAEGEQESPQERLQRLKCETSELLEQLITIKQTESEDEKISIKDMTSQLESTKQILEDLHFDDNEKDSEMDKLKNLLEKAGVKKSDDKNQTAAAIIKLRPDSSNLMQTTRLAKLEHRLHKLETAVGPIPDRIDRVAGAASVTNNKGLIPTVNSLAARMAILQPSQIDAAEQRLNRLLPAIETLKNASSADPERDQKINELYDIVKKTEGISHTQILERMQTLEALHKQANDFGKSMTELRNLQGTITSGVQNNKTLLQGVQEVFASNFDNIQKEIKKLEERLSSLKK